MSRLDLSRTPVPLDAAVIHTLHSQLHTFKKCFSGKEFVEQLLRVGREAEATRQSSSEPTTPSPQIAFQQRSPRTGSRHIYNSPTSGAGARIFYTVHYAKEVGQFLLSERILLPLPSLRQHSPDFDSDYEEDDDEEEEEEERVLTSRQHESSSIQSDQRVIRVDVEEGGGGGGGGANLSVPSSSENSPRLQPSRRRAPLDYRTDVQERSNSASQIPVDFVYSPQSLYKFANVEDFESRALYHSQILSASAHPQAADGLEETTAFEKARMGMLFLVYDLLLQRARREKRVKQFLQTPPALSVADRRKRQFVDCNLIFKM